MKFLNLLIACLFASTVAHAAGGVTTGGGGGGGVAVGSSFVLLDLYNEGLEASGVLAPQKEVDAALWHDLVEQGQLKSLDPAATTEFIKKIAQVEMIDPYFAAALVSTLNLLSWHIVDLDFLPTKDISESESLNGQAVIPLAIRQGQTISISRSKWDHMDLLNRTALLMHEVVAAITPASLPADVTRRTVARLFDARFFDSGAKSMQVETLRAFPSIESVQKLLNPKRRRTGFYTRANFSPLDERFAFWDARFPPKVELTSHFYFEPLWEADQVDRSGLVGALLGQAPAPPIAILPLLSGPANRRACDLKRGSVQTLSVTITAYELVTWAAPVTDLKMLARVNWGLREKELADIQFAKEDSGTVLNCSANNRVELQKLELLANTLYPFSASAD